MLKNKSKNILNYSVIIEKDPKSGYFAYAPSLPGCNTQGKTIEQTVERMKEAMIGYLESQKADGEKLPVSTFITLTSVSVTI